MQPPDPSPHLHGLYWLLANLAATGPVLLALDDLQLLDSQSASLIAFLQRRLAEHPVLLAATLRTGDGTLEGALAAITEAEADLLASIRPQRLSTDAAERMVRGAGVDLSEADEERLVLASDGIPYMSSSYSRARLRTVRSRGGERSWRWATK